MKNTITECISGNTIARMNPFPFGFLSVDLSFTLGYPGTYNYQDKGNKILTFHRIMK